MRKIYKTYETHVKINIWKWKRIKYEKYGFLLREQIFNLMTFNTFWSLNDVIFANEDIIYNNLMISARQKEEMKYFMI